LPPAVVEHAVGFEGRVGWIEGDAFAVAVRAEHALGVESRAQGDGGEKEVEL
jgi:hypothetical protein